VGGVYTVNLTVSDGSLTNMASVEITISASPSPSPIFRDDFETGDFSKWSEVVDAGEGQIVTNIKHGGSFGMRHGGQNGGASVTAGDVLLNVTERDEYYALQWWYFDPLYILPPPGGGPHYLRLTGPSGSFQLDFVIPDALSAIKLNCFPGNTGGNTVQKQTSYNPITDAIGGGKGVWQKWVVRFRLNTPGNADGLVEFWVNDTFIDSMTGNFRGTSTDQITRYLAVSNIGGNKILWPVNNWLYRDDIELWTTKPPGTP